jgi:hypothetical protein
MVWMKLEKLLNGNLRCLIIPITKPVRSGQINVLSGCSDLSINFASGASLGRDRPTSGWTLRGDSTICLSRIHKLVLTASAWRSLVNLVDVTSTSPRSLVLTKALFYN